MCEIVDYLQSLNPSKDEQPILFYGRNYKLWREGNYLGIATWTQDENIGDSFQVGIVNDKGIIIQQVYVADRWELVISDKDNHDNPEKL